MFERKENISFIGLLTSFLEFMLCWPHGPSHRAGYKTRHQAQGIQWTWGLPSVWTRRISPISGFTGILYITPSILIDSIHSSKLEIWVWKLWIFIWMWVKLATSLIWLLWWYKKRPRSMILTRYFFFENLSASFNSLSYKLLYVCYISAMVSESQIS